MTHSRSHQVLLELKPPCGLVFLWLWLRHSELHSGTLLTTPKLQAGVVPNQV